MFMGEEGGEMWLTGGGGVFLRGDSLMKRWLDVARGGDRAKILQLPDNSAGKVCLVTPVTDPALPEAAGR